jgi:plasmid stabilization system protein ParE
VCVEEAIDRVLENPRAFPTVHLTARRALIRRFPDALLFRVRDYRVKIEAVFHGSRDPIAWQNRIG